MKFEEVRRPSVYVVPGMHRLNIKELVRKHLQENGRKTYIHRIAYIFEYTPTEHSINEKFEKLIEKQLDEYYDEPISGCLFLYDKNVALHIIEGSDYVILKHMESLLKNNESVLTETGIERMKLFQFVSHVRKRVHSKWLVYSVSPPPSSSITLSQQADEIDTCNRYSKGLQMFKSLKDFLERNEGKSSISTKAGEAFVRRVNKLIPTAELIQFLLGSPILENFKDFIQKASYICDIYPYHEIVWPLPIDHVPDYNEVLKPEDIIKYKENEEKLMKKMNETNVIIKE